jgi:hypothetical protein
MLSKRRLTLGLRRYNAYTSTILLVQKMAIRSTDFPMLAGDCDVVMIFRVDKL